MALQLDTDYDWSWEVIGVAEYSRSSSINIYGVTAMALLNACKLTGTEVYKEAARKIADMMKGYNTNYGDFHDTGLGQSWDLRFLISCAELSGDTAYSDFVRNYWEWIKSPGSGHELYADGNQENFYQFYIGYGVTPGYATWDCVIVNGDDITIYYKSNLSIVN